MSKLFDNMSKPFDTNKLDELNEALSRFKLLHIPFEEESFIVIGPMIDSHFHEDLREEEIIDIEGYYKEVCVCKTHDLAYSVALAMAAKYPPGTEWD